MDGMTRKNYAKAGAAVAAAGIFTFIFPGTVSTWAKEPEKIEIFSDAVYELEELETPDPQWMDPQGRYYELCGWEIEEVKEEPWTEQVQVTEVFYGLENENQIQETRTIQREDTRTGQIEETQGKKTRVQAVGERWQEAADVPLICYLGMDEKGGSQGETIIYNEETPPQLACLSMLADNGLPEDSYQIETIAWDGEIFEDGEGRLCRMIRTEGKRLLKDYQVTYEGAITYPQITSYRTKAVYQEREETEETTEESEDMADMTGNGEGEQDKEKSGSSEAALSDGGETETERETTLEQIWEKGPGKMIRLIRERKEITISFGACLAGAAVLWIAFRFLLKKKKK